MKKYLMSIALAAAVSVPSFAQTTPQKTETTTDIQRTYQNATPVKDLKQEPTLSDFDRMVRSAYNVELRSLAANALDLNEEQITDFTPLYINYVQAKDVLLARRQNLIKEYKEEMAEDDTARDEENETADFIESFMGLDIAEMQIKKDFFDQMEDRIGAMNTLKFFELEKQFETRVKRALLTEKLPDLFLLVPKRYTAYDREMEDYSNWNKINITGEVSVDHDYTHEGLTKLMTAIEAMTDAEGITVKDFDNRKSMVMEKADMMQKNWRSLEHADYARAAFTETASMLKEVAMDSRFAVNGEWTSKLTKQAKAIKPSVKLTDQASEVRAFFKTAEMIINDLVEQADASTKK